MRIRIGFNVHQHIILINYFKHWGWKAKTLYLYILEFPKEIFKGQTISFFLKILKEKIWFVEDFLSTNWIHFLLIHLSDFSNIILINSIQIIQQNQGLSWFILQYCNKYAIYRLTNLQIHRFSIHTRKYISYFINQLRIDKSHMIRHNSIDYKAWNHELPYFLHYQKL